MRFSVLALSGAAVFAVGCDYTGDFLFANPTELVPGVQHLGTLEPFDVTGPDDIRANAVYGEVGSTGSAAVGGVTFTFEGTGSAVCVFVDPELAFWNQAVSQNSPTVKFAYPDNVFDDGDIDLFAGFSVYYNGSPGQTVGNFEVQYEDSLGNKVPVELNECTIAGLNEPSGGHGGRGSPEYCALVTQPNVRYTVLLENFSTPLDDARLGYGVVLANGNCRQMLQTAGAISDECVIIGEGIKPDDSWDYRDDPVRSVGLDDSIIWEGSLAFEEAFCLSASGPSTALYDYCKEEAENVEAQGASCADDDVRCYCGDPTDTPTGGSF